MLKVVWASVRKIKMSWVGKHNLHCPPFCGTKEYGKKEP
jgi:hypothetical protein